MERARTGSGRARRRAAHPKRTVLPGPQPEAGSAAGRIGPGGGNPLLKAAGRFHGHIGPFLAIGMRMGLVANEEIGRDPFGVEAEIAVEAKPPRSCLVDGVQYATGCTLGKGNIRIRPGSDSISACFSRGERRITVTLRQDLLGRLERDLEGMAEKAIIDYAFEIMDTPAVDLFEVT